MSVENLSLSLSLAFDYRTSARVIQITRRVSINITTNEYDPRRLLSDLLLVARKGRYDSKGTTIVARLKKNAPHDTRYQISRIYEIYHLI